jgi:tetratricopeptide (TPR) repeat protein
MRRLLFVLLLSACAGAWAQNSSSPPANSSSSRPSDSAPQNSQTPNSGTSPSDKTPEKPGTALAPNQPPRSDSVDADALGDEPGQSSSKDTRIDLSPPPDDEKAHPQSSEMLMDAEAGDSTADVNEFHPWDPHKAAKNVEVGDFYFKRKNYRAAEDRYREALLYKNNDAVATFRLAVCLEKLDQPDQASKEYESYLKILPHGPQADEAQKAIERLKGPKAAK